MRYLLLSLSCAVRLFWGANASCYYPDRSFPDDYVYVPCSSDEFTSCCILSEGNQCLSNGLCWDTWSEYMFRGGCTDQSWNSTNCFQHCKTGDSSSSYDPLVTCGEGRYCCSSDSSTCCNDDSKVFTLDTATVIKNLATTGTYTIPIATPTSFPSSKPETTATSEAEPEPTQTDKDGKPTSTSRRTDSAAAASSTSTSAPSTSEAESASHGLSKTVLIAIAVAGVVVLLLAVGLVWFFVRRRYRKKLAAGTNTQSFPMASEGFQKLPDKSPRPVEVPAPMNSPAPPYQPPAYVVPPQNGAVEIGHFDGPPVRNPYGQPVYEIPAQNYPRQ
ncbi:hypothetical protein P154DRAFT_568240 [Amniculicola lignicola CBS 123094]|uniref:Mid2 domain-containing protein n=1 Tax=Amniculicola lignicola CBS 123094 TaxID=1392246 RepID=A0A6A5W1N9_9PLEO|nr:hypothetical protein P154DRAFT_568240 [Amniculicola lignicola CBS 123094]